MDHLARMDVAGVQRPPWLSVIRFFVGLRGKGATHAIVQSIPTRPALALVDDMRSDNRAWKHRHHNV